MPAVSRHIPRPRVAVLARAGIHRSLRAASPARPARSSRASGPLPARAPRDCPSRSDPSGCHTIPAGCRPDSAAASTALRGSPASGSCRARVRTPDTGSPTAAPWSWPGPAPSAPATCPRHPIPSPAALPLPPACTASAERPPRRSPFGRPLSRPGSGPSTAPGTASESLPRTDSAYAPGTAPPTRPPHSAR